MQLAQIQSQIPLNMFAAELAQDLTSLMVRYPNGIPTSVLHEEYGEPVPRIIRACMILQERGLIIFKDGTPPYIIPTSFEPPIAQPYHDLTDLQRRLFFLLIETSGPTNLQIQTSYYQLARLLDCSSGGARSTLERLATLNYITVLQPPIQGKVNSLILQLNKEKIAVDHHLPS